MELHWMERVVRHRSGFRYSGVGTQLNLREESPVGNANRGTSEDEEGDEEDKDEEEEILFVVMFVLEDEEDDKEEAVGDEGIGDEEGE